MDELLTHPHSRYVASTNYEQHYAQQYEKEIVSRKNEFDAFFKQYREVKEKQAAFHQLNKQLAVNQKSLQKIDYNQLDRQIENLMNTKETQGKISEKSKFLTISLSACNNFAQQLTEFVDNNYSKKYKLDKNDSFNAPNPDEIIEKARLDVREIMDSIIEIEHDYQQALLDDADSQTIEAKKRLNSNSTPANA